MDVPSGDEIARAREALGLTQAEVATAAGVSQSTVWRCENGIHGGSSRTLGAILRVVRLDPNRATRPSLEDASDMELTAAVMARLGALRTKVGELESENEQLRADSDRIGSMPLDDTETEAGQPDQRNRNSAR